MSANEKLIKLYSSKLGEKKGTKRIWIESKKLHDTNFAEHLRYEPEYDFDNKRITLRPGFTNKITIREKNNMPIIDILNHNVSEIFKGFTHIVIKLFNDEIVIEPLKEEIKQGKAKARATCDKSHTLTSVEIFAGGGTLVKSLRDSGINCIAAVELEDKYLANLEANNPDITTYCGDLAKLDVSTLPNADILVAGIPCSAFSNAQRTSERFEAHPTGSLGFYVLKIIDAIRPGVVLIEEVPNFKSSAIANVVRYVLDSMGYFIEETELKGSDYGSLTRRKRFCMVASMKKGFKFDDSYKKENTRTVEDILEIPHDERTWLTRENSKSIAYSLDKEQEHIAKGEGFRLARTSIDDTVVATVTKGYFKNRLTDPILVNADDSNKFSWFTPRELARLNGLPEDFILEPTAKSTCGEIIGQGVCYEAFNSVGKMIVNHFHSEEYDEELVKRESFISAVRESNVTEYEDAQLGCFMAGSLF